ncbi:MAG: hypothetical protein ABGX26_08175 [Nautiliaceae bacterium]
MKKLFFLIFGSLLFAKSYVGIQLMGGIKGDVKIKDSSYETSPFEDSNDIASYGAKIYIQNGKYYIFYQRGQINPKTENMDIHNYNVFGAGYLGVFASKVYKVAKMDFFVDLCLGYDKMNSLGSGKYDESKEGLYLGAFVGESMYLVNYPKVSYDISFGYEMHSVKDSVSKSVSENANWDFDSFMIKIGSKFEF